MINCVSAGTASANGGLDVAPTAQAIAVFDSFQRNQPEKVILKVLGKRALHQLPV